MHLRLTPEQEAFRASAASWLERNLPTAPRPGFGPDMAAFDRAWQHRAAEAGFAGISWPERFGGRGLGPVEDLIWWEECARVGAPRPGVNIVGLSHAGPTLMAYGTQDQQAAHLAGILSGEHVWCQGFSEPDAGSDLGALRTRAVVDGDTLVVSGQKTWSGYAQFARFQELLVRVPDVGVSGRKHDGITWVICDMSLPGIEIRPVATMDGGEHFCEVFYDQVRIPLSAVVGELGRGWQVAMANLGFERATGQIAAHVELLAVVRRLVRLAEQLPGYDGARLVDDPGVRARLAALTAEARALRALTYAVISAGHGDEGDASGDAVMVRLWFTELTQRVQATAADLLGGRLAFHEPGDAAAEWLTGYLTSFKETIAGGTSDIQRNTIARQVLNLPRGR